MANEKNVAAFDNDVTKNKGYLYTTTNKISCNFANRRISDAVWEMAGGFEGKTVIDIGCGDGIYTMEFLKMNPAFLRGVDANESAISMAKQKTSGIKNIDFAVVDIYKLTPPENRYDIAIVRGILHHLYDVETAISLISKMAKIVIVVEPNGYNPVLKIIERTSRYHIEHEEKSYSPKNLDKWFLANGGVIEKSMFIGLVPMFCPNFMARICKLFEPLVEHIPLLRQFACGQYVQKIKFE